MKWMSIGFKLLPIIMMAVKTVERFLTEPKGQAKEDAAVEVVKSLLEGIEGVSAKDLLDDEEVQAATRNVMRAVVSLQNIIAKKRAQHDA